MSTDEIAHKVEMDASRTYGEAYYRHYSHNADTPYRRDDPAWQGFFGEIARQIVLQLNPRTAFDAGCALGMLVEALRDQGVEASGVDISEYAITQVRADLRAYCRVGSITDELDREYDLITCIEILEHLNPDEADRAVANFARHTRTVLLSSTPDDYREPTHINVQPSDYWVGLFARYGFVRDLDFDAYFVSQHAMLLRREIGPPLGALRAYERQLVQAQRELVELREQYRGAVEVQQRLQRELEHYEFERGLLSGEATHWEWRASRAESGAQRAAPDGADGGGAPARDSRPMPRLTERIGQQAMRVSRLLRRTSSARTPIPDNNRIQSAALDAPTVNARRVLFISDGSDGPRRYRCDHQAEALRLGGWSADVITYQDAFGSLLPYLDGYDIFVLQRLPSRPNLELLVRGAREHGKPVLYDVDDLIFDPDMAFRWGPFETMTEADRWSTKHGMWRNRRALELCDAVLVPTLPLQERISDAKRRAFVIANAVSQQMLMDAEDALAMRPTLTDEAHALVTLGYMSGTPTHDRDFAQIVEPIEWALRTYPSTRLLIVGPLHVPDALAAFGERVQHRDLVQFAELPAVLAQVSINLAPVEPDNVFTECKSCIKYLEAGLLNVPTIASPRSDFARVIRDAQNGLLAQSTDEWRSALKSLIEQPLERARIGEQARIDIIQHHTSAARSDPLQSALLDVLVAIRHA
jgi:glycosyltransferase involved in cell wall biosynthesis